MLGLARGNVVGHGEDPGVNGEQIGGKLEGLRYDGEVGLARLQEADDGLEKELVLLLLRFRHGCKANVLETGDHLDNARGHHRIQPTSVHIHDIPDAC